MSSLNLTGKHGNLVRLIQKYALEIKKPGEEPFTLSSGKQSNYYLDLRKVLMIPEGAFAVGEAIAWATHKLDFDSVGGMETAAIPIISAVLNYFYLFPESNNYKKITGFWVKKNPKDHGTKSQIEGIIKGRVLLVDDVITTGESINKAKEIVNRLGFLVVGELGIVNRLEDGTFIPTLLTIKDLGIQ